MATCELLYYSVTTLKTNLLYKSINTFMQWPPFLQKKTKKTKKDRKESKKEREKVMCVNCLFHWFPWVNIIPVIFWGSISLDDWSSKMALQI